MVTLAEIARRVDLSKQRVSKLARTDPDFPVPPDRWQKVGRYYLLPWGPVKAYFDARSPEHGVHHATRIARRGRGGASS
jgi:hypothetical protein